MGAGTCQRDTLHAMNYSSLVPVLQIVLITVLALIDMALFACSRMLGIVEAGTAVTLDLSVQFIGAGKPGTPCDAVTEVLKETRRLVFLRGVVEQGEGNLIAAFSGTIRKPTAPR